MRKLHDPAVTLALILVLGILSGLGFIVGPGTPAARSEEYSTTSRRPNIIFVLTDDQMPGTEKRMRALQNNLVQEGATFSNTVSTYPLCCPGRATIQRGQYSHNTKIYGNSAPQGGWTKFRRLGEHRSTVARWLNASGYQTGLFGK